MKKCIFYAGLPASGKTTHYNENYKSFESEYDLDPTHEYINPDILRDVCDGSKDFMKMVDLDILKPKYRTLEGHELAFQYRAALTKSKVKRTIEEGEDFVLDSGSINKSYTKDLLEYAKKHDYIIGVIYVKESPLICIERNKIREAQHKVPEQVIIDKSTNIDLYMMNLCTGADWFRIV